VLYSILLYVVCHCVICVVDCGAYMGSKTIYINLIDCKHNLTRFKCAHRNMDMVKKPSNLTL